MQAIPAAERPRWSPSWSYPLGAFDGETPNEAIEMIEKAKHLWLTVALKHHDLIHQVIAKGRKAAVGYYRECTFVK